MKITTLSLLSLWIAATAATSASGDALYRGCTAWVGKYKFQCAAAGKAAKIKGKQVSGCHCWSPEYLATYVDCVERADGGNKPSALVNMVADCHGSKARPDLTVADAMAAWDNATDFFVPVSSVKNKTMTSYSPIKFTQAQVNQALRSFAAGFYAKYSGRLYG